MLMGLLSEPASGWLEFSLLFYIVMCCTEVTGRVLVGLCVGSFVFLALGLNGSWLVGPHSILIC